MWIPQIRCSKFWLLWLWSCTTVPGWTPLYRGRGYHITENDLNFANGIPLFFATTIWSNGFPATVWPGVESLLSEWSKCSCDHGMSSKSVESHGADLETSPTEIMKPRFPAHTAPKKKGGWNEPAECPSKSHHCCRCWGGTSATECGKRARKREVMALLGWAKVIREWLPTMRGVWSSWKKTDCNYEDSPYHFWMTFGEFRCLVLRRVAVYNLKIRIATTLSSIHQLTTSLQMHCRKDFAVWNSEKMSFREDRVVPICSISS